MSAGLAERLPPGFPLEKAEKALANLRLLYAELQLKLLREGLPQI